MRETNYHQPFLQIIPLNQYPKVTKIVNDLFPKKDIGIKNNLYTIICGLLVHPKIAVSRDYKYYEFFPGPSWYTQKRAIKSQNLLVEKGLAKLKRGRPAKPGFETGFSSVISSTDNLDNLLHGIILKGIKVDPEHHAIIALNKKPLTLEEISQFDCSFFNSDSPLNKKILKSAYRDTQNLNQNYFSNMVLGFEPGMIITAKDMLFEEARWTFKEKRTPATGMASNVFFTSMFSLKGDGRLFQRCESYQNLKRILRKRLTINGKSTGEADYSSMHINLSYFISGHKNPYLDDSYSPIIEKLGLKKSSNLRDAIKKCVLIAFNTSNFSSCSKAMYWNNRKDARLLKKRGTNIRKVCDTFIELNPKVEYLFNSKSIVANSLMFHESIIMRKLLKNLSGKGINALPLHDSLIYDNKYKGRVEDVMRKTYQSVTGNDIGIKTLL